MSQSAAELLAAYHWYDFVGNVGVVLVLLSYLLLQLDRLDVKGLTYSVMNAVGAVLILVSLYYNFNLSSVIIELVWLGISLFAITRSVFFQSTAPAKHSSDGG